ncbi:unnamed protein product [Closterium sp. NIES-54]
MFGLIPLFLEDSVWQFVRQAIASIRVSVSGQLAVSCSCRLLSHQTLLWHHRLGHPSLLRLRSMHSRLLVSGLPRSVPPLPRSPALPCLLSVERRQCAAPHSSEFPPTTAPLQTLHMDVGGDFSSDLLEEFCRDEGICQTFMLPASPQQNGIAERRIGLIMEVAHTSMIHAAAPHFRWPFAVRYAAHQINLWPRVSEPETLPTSGQGRLAMCRCFRSGVRSALFAMPKRASSPLALSAASSLASPPTPRRGSLDSQWKAAMDFLDTALRYVRGVGMSMALGSPSRESSMARREGEAAAKNSSSNCLSSRTSQPRADSPPTDRGQGGGAATTRVA